MATKISVKRQIPRDQRPIPHWLAKHPIYAETLQSLLETDKHELIEDPFCRIETIKQIMRRASKKALRKILCRDPHSPESQLQFVLQAARAVAFNDSKMARTLTKSPALIGKLIEINPEGVVTMTCPPPVSRMRLENRQRANRETNHRKRARHLPPKRRQSRPTQEASQALVPLRLQGGQPSHHQKRWDHH